MEGELAKVKIVILPGKFSFSVREQDNALEFYIPWNNLFLQWQLFKIYCNLEIVKRGKTNNEIALSDYKSFTEIIALV